LVLPFDHLFFFSGCIVDDVRLLFFFPFFFLLPKNLPTKSTSSSFRAETPGYDGPGMCRRPRRNEPGFFLRIAPIRFSFALDPLAASLSQHFLQDRFAPFPPPFSFSRKQRSPPRSFGDRTPKPLSPPRERIASYLENRKERAIPPEKPFLQIIKYSCPSSAME